MSSSVQLVRLVNNKPIFAGLALITHYVLHSDEWDNSFNIVLGFWSLLFGGCTAAEYIYDTRAKSIADAIRFTSATATVYFGVLVTSILLHRGFFHRLRNIPGPFLARFSKFYVIFAGVLPTRFQLYMWIERLHEEYKTDVIRTGPREVAVYCADAIPLIHGALSRCTKGPWYQGTQHIGGDSAHTTRNKDEHKRRRRDWDHAFSAKALREYEPRLNRHALALMTQLKEVATQPSIRITDWINFYSFDVMGDIGFNRSFGMVEKGEEDPLIKLLHQSMAGVAVMGQLTWLLNLLLHTSFGAKPMVEHIMWTKNVLEERAKMTPPENDIASWLLDPNDPKVTKDLGADARLLVVAGSDTTSATLAWACYELCKHPEIQAKLGKFIDEIEPTKSHLQVDDVANCSYLDGVISEALRLHPAVPSGVQRETPPEGLMLPNGTYIPGNIHIWMPMHTIHRDARYFQKPTTFLPERWTSEQPEAIIDKRAFMPFGTGVYNCVGQKLAFMEMRSVLANLIRSFEISFADGEDGTAIITDSQDVFTTNVGKLDVKLTPRYKD